MFKGSVFFFFFGGGVGFRDSRGGGGFRIIMRSLGLEDRLPKKSLIQRI